MVPFCSLHHIISNDISTLLSPSWSESKDSGNCDKRAKLAQRIRKKLLFAIYF